MDLLNYLDKGGQNPLASILRKDSIVLGITAAIYPLLNCTSAINVIIVSLSTSESMLYCEKCFQGVSV